MWRLGQFAIKCPGSPHLKHPLACPLGAGLLTRGGVFLKLLLLLGLFSEEGAGTAHSVTAGELE